MSRHRLSFAGVVLLAACASQPPQAGAPTVGGPLPAITYQPIGVIHSPFHEQKGTPIQPVFAGPARGRIVLEPQFRAALADLAGFERVWLVYDFDRAGPFTAKVTPYRDTVARGLFATRAPTRPNRIGISSVKLVAVEADGILVEEIDVLDGTPLLDIKPYVPQFDAYPAAKAGWLDDSSSERRQADERFEPGRK